MDWRNVKKFVVGEPYDAEVEYLESNGTQIISVPNPYPDAMPIDLQVTGGANQLIFSCGGTRGYGKFITDADGNYAVDGNLSGVDSFNIPGTTRVTALVTNPKSNGYITDVEINGVSKRATRGRGVTSNNMSFLGNANFGYGSMRIYGIGHYKLVRVGQVGCLYDPETGDFIYPSTGTLACGPDTRVINRQEVVKISSGSTVLWKKPLPYITDGLVVLWDGEWNAGAWRHDSSANTWVNVANPGTRDVTLTRASNGWESNALKTKVVTGGAAATVPAGTFSPALSVSDVKQVEMVYRVDTPQNANGEVLIFVGGASGRFAFSSVGGGTAGQILILSTPDTRVATEAVGTTGVDPNIGATGMLHTVSVSIPSSTYGTGWAIYENGVSQPIFDRGGTLSTQSDGTGSICGRTSTTSSPDNAAGKLICIRFYSRTLTAAEVAANAAVDRQRFNLT